MSGLNLLTRVHKQFTKVITFDGLSVGTIGTLQIANITGQVHIHALSIRCITSCTGSGATGAIGTTSATTGLISTTTMTGVTAGKLWNSTSPTAGVLAAAGVDKIVNEAINLLVATAAITGGSIEIGIEWSPMAAGSKLG